MGVYAEYSQVRTFGHYTSKIIEGTSTGFNGVFTEDELFNKDEPQLFQYTYEGRFVVSTGKEATK